MAFSQYKILYFINKPSFQLVSSLTFHALIFNQNNIISGFNAKIFTVCLSFYLKGTSIEGL